MRRRAKRRRAITATSTLQRSRLEGLPRTILVYSTPGARLWLARVSARARDPSGSPWLASAAEGAASTATTTKAAIVLLISFCRASTTTTRMGYLERADVTNSLAVPVRWSARPLLSRAFGGECGVGADRGAHELGGHDRGPAAGGRIAVPAGQVMALARAALEGELGQEHRLRDRVPAGPGRAQAAVQPALLAGRRVLGRGEGDLGRLKAAGTRRRLLVGALVGLALIAEWRWPRYSLQRSVRRRSSRREHAGATT